VQDLLIRGGEKKNERNERKDSNAGTSPAAKVIDIRVDTQYDENRRRECE
jgi:hypothetical protein